MPLLLAFDFSIPLSVPGLVFAFAWGLLIFLVLIALWAWMEGI
jgi:hypothetical protein